MLVSNYAWMMMASLSTVFGDVRSDVILYSLSELSPHYTLAVAGAVDDDDDDDFDT